MTYRNRIFVILGVLGVALLAVVQVLFAIGEGGAGTAVRQVDASLGQNSGDCLSQPCQTIAYGLQQANPGDSIDIAAGVYVESLTLDKAVSLIGAGAEVTIVEAEPAQRVLTVTGSHIDNNTIISGLTFRGGRPLSADGGGILIDQASPIIQDGIITDNIASGDGGGLYITNSIGLILRRTEISHNTASSAERGLGGGVLIANSQNIVLEDNLWQENVAWRGGGLYLGSVVDVSLTASRFISNTAGFGDSLKFGGALRVLSSQQVTATNNVVRGNIAWNSGGGFSIQATQDIALLGNIFQFNESDFGGALAVQTTSLGQFVNNVLIDNMAGSQGGAAYVSISQLDWWHTTIARNSTDPGAAINVGDNGITPSFVAMTNTIMSEQAIGFANSGLSSLTLDGVLEHMTDTLISGTVGIALFFVGDPHFAPDGYHLLAGSEAINQGVLTSIDWDIDGEKRPFNNNPDLGADEFMYAHFLPLVYKETE